MRFSRQFIKHVVAYHHLERSLRMVDFEINNFKSGDDDLADYEILYEVNNLLLKANKDPFSKRYQELKQ